MLKTLIALCGWAVVLLMAPDCRAEPPQLRNEDITATLEHRQWIFTCTAPGIVSRDVPAQIRLELTNRDSLPFLVLNRAPALGDQGLFSLSLVQDAQPGEQPVSTSVPNPAGEPQWRVVDPGETIEATIDVGPALRDFPVRQSMVDIAVEVQLDLDEDNVPGGYSLHVPGPLRFRVLLLDQFEYHLRVQFEQKRLSRDAATARPTTRPAE